MNTEEKLLHMFHEVHKDSDFTKFSVEVYENEMMEAAGVHVSKEGSLCWSASKQDLLFEYITKDWQ